MKKYAVGIDPGVNTGIAFWNIEQECFEKGMILTLMIHEAMEVVAVHAEWIEEVIVEDARKAVYGRNTKKDRAKAKGAGSVMRDCKIWNDFLLDSNIPFFMKKVSKQMNQYATPDNLMVWQQMTGYNERTSEHARIASLLVLDYKGSYVRR